MARIRSIHPGFFTDENLVCASMAARMLFLGVGVEADDKGVFEWKPLTLKMRIFPADNVDVAGLLAELQQVGAIKLYEVSGRQYGAIRNFRKFQKPKTPNDIYPATAEIREFVGLISEKERGETGVFPPSGETFPQKGEIGAQMEDGEEDGEEDGKKKKDYAFFGQIVRLNQKDHAAWRRRFHSIADLDAELSTLDVWLGRQAVSKQRDWFITGASWLNRRHQENMTKSKQGAGYDQIVC